MVHTGILRHTPPAVKQRGEPGRKFLQATSGLPVMNRAVPAVNFSSPSGGVSGKMIYMKYALLFRVDKTLMALDVRSVSHVLKKMEVTPVPDAPDFVEGVFPYKEHIVSVIKLSVKYGLTPVKGDRLFLAMVDEMLVAFRVTEILDVIKVNKEDIEISDPNLPVSGVLIREGKPVMLLDLNRILPEKDRKLLRALY